MWALRSLFKLVGVKYRKVKVNFYKNSQVIQFEESGWV